MSDAKSNFFRSLGLTGSIQDMERAFYDGSFVKVPYILAQSAVPVILAPSGTVATNGTVTLGTALPSIYSSGAWIRLPAGAVVGGLAGLYWCVFSSTTVGQVYTAFEDPSTEFVPYTPSSLVAVVGSNSAYTQTISTDITLINITLDGGAMGADGSARQTLLCQYPNNANNKIIKIKLDGLELHSSTLTTTASVYLEKIVTNRGSEARQVSPTVGLIGNGTASGSVVTGTVDTSIDNPISVTGRLAVATDFVIVESILSEVLPSL